MLQRDAVSSAMCNHSVHRQASIYMNIDVLTVIVKVIACGVGSDSTEI